jgi:hypothetical protein
MVAHGQFLMEQESSTWSMPETKLLPHRRSVNFKEKITVYRILSRHQLTKKEFKDCYMNATDFSRIRRGIKWILKQEKEGFLRAEDMDHLRGLEAYIDQETTMQNAVKKKYIIRSVLSHPHSGVEDSEAMSKIYRKLSKTPARLAYKRGLCDQQGNSSVAPVQEVMDR